MKKNELTTPPEYTHAAELTTSQTRIGDHCSQKMLTLDHVYNTLMNPCKRYKTLSQLTSTEEQHDLLSTTSSIDMVLDNPVTDAENRKEGGEMDHATIVYLSYVLVSDICQQSLVLEYTLYYVSVLSYSQYVKNDL